MSMPDFGIMRLSFSLAVGCAIATSVLSFSRPLDAQSIGMFRNDPNEVILKVIRSMPQGGGYSASNGAIARLSEAARIERGTLVLDPAIAKPSFCSEATYLVFLTALADLNNQAPITGPLAESLAVKGQPDGVGIWGRWNANGPGTACLFHELQLGDNFTDWNSAHPGDFMKIFWNTNVGRREHGHSAIYLGTTTQNGVEWVSFWSSNIPNGFGEKQVLKTKIASVIFSRLRYPERLQRNFATLPRRNSYLAGLLSRESSLAEARANSGVE
ncbi:MAG: hypothetical protein WAK31_31785 [Chthoniobacterales bacterium]